MLNLKECNRRESNEQRVGVTKEENVEIVVMIEFPIELRLGLLLHKTKTSDCDVG